MGKPDAGTTKVGREALRAELLEKELRAERLYSRLSQAGEDALAGRDAELRPEWEEWQGLLGAMSGTAMALDRACPLSDLLPADEPQAY